MAGLQCAQRMDGQGWLRQRPSCAMVCGMLGSCSDRAGLQSKSVVQHGSGTVTDMQSTSIIAIDSTLLIFTSPSTQAGPQ